MNTRNLLADLQHIGLPATTIAVGGVAEDHYCITETEDDQWEVFFYERGVKRGRIVVATEDIACTYLFGRLAHSQVMSERLVLPKRRTRSPAQRGDHGRLGAPGAA